MNKKSKGYILAIVLTISAASFMGYELKVSGVNISISNKKREVIAAQGKETEKNNTNMEIKLSDREELLKVNPIGKKIKNNFNYPDKEKIHFKMINAVDNFKTCKGEFNEESTMLNLNGKYTFAVDTENKSSVSVIKESGKKPVTLIYHDDKRKVFEDEDKSYREFEEKQEKEKPTIVRPFELYLNPTSNRTDIGYLGVSSDIICAEAFSKYLYIYEDWNYTETTFLGRNVYKLEGVIDPHLGGNMKGKFSLLMDKETGIVLQFLSFDDNGKIKDKLEVSKLEVNTPIDKALYNKSTSGYTKK
ncbi:hypothetical protein HAHI6034_04465 [Hathewaya histolytica]|uniref:Lipoprotein n=1 Tax=Hathewaya histolytica TaxID=1498 RepID=A0A4U9RSV4_HATHI|nr:hypothetical protein [Hathewaya histolytica]VTQ94043.1 Uncharacterised protein [Hathewaya histolytica]